MHTILPHNPCSVGLALTTMDEEMYIEFNTWLTTPKDSKTISDSIMWTVLDDLGYWVSGQGLGRHRRKTCSCFTTKKPPLPSTKTDTEE